MRPFVIIFLYFIMSSATPDLKPLGAHWEFITTGVIISLISLALGVFTFLNLFGESLGAFGRKFIFEMDEVMGGLLGLPHYSKFEAVMLAFGTAAGVLCWFPTCQLWTIICMTIGAMYLGICVVYSRYARQDSGPFFVIIVPILGCAVWRVVRFLPSTQYAALAPVVGVEVLLILVSICVMRHRAPLVEEKIVRLILLNKCEKKGDFTWHEGYDDPEGFETIELEDKQSNFSKNAILT